MDGAISRLTWENPKGEKNTFCIEVTSVTAVEDARKACSYTTGAESTISLDKLAKCEHSPLRTQLFWVEMKGIPSFVSTHFVRHKFGVEHFVKSNRDDRGGDGTEDRYTPVDHAMFVNAQELIFMARKRLCHNAHWLTREVMNAITALCPDWLIPYMVPDCAYRGACYELKSCGRAPKA